MNNRYKKTSKVCTDTIGSRVRRIRKDLKMKQAELARRLKLSVPGLSEIENGKYKPGHDFFYHMANELDVNLYYLLFGEEPVFIEKDERPGRDMPPNGEMNTEIKEFLHYFHHSDLVRYRIMGAFKVFLLESGDLIRLELEQKNKTGRLSGYLFLTELDSEKNLIFQWI